MEVVGQQKKKPLNYLTTKSLARNEKTKIILLEIKAGKKTNRNVLCKDIKHSLRLILLCINLSYQVSIKHNIKLLFIVITSYILINQKIIYLISTIRYQCHDKIKNISSIQVFIFYMSLHVCVKGGIISTTRFVNVTTY